MILGIDSTVSLGLALADIRGGTFYNWQTRMMESSGLVAASHVRPMASSKLAPAPAPSGSTAPTPPADLHANTKYVDCENALESDMKLSAIWYVLDAAGTPRSVYAIDSNPAQGRWAATAAASQ